MSESRLNSLALVGVMISLMTFGGNMVSSYNSITNKLAVLESEIRVLHDKISYLQKAKSSIK